jgi:LasA protease
VAFASAQPTDLTTEASVAVGSQATAVRFAAVDGWEIGTLAFPGEDPIVKLYLVRAGASAGAGAVAVEGTAEFEALAREAGPSFAGSSAETLLAPTGIGAGASDSAALSLPWAGGKSWRLTGGPHNHQGQSRHPWSSLDFAGPVAGASYKVKAARGGVVLRPCANLIQIRHSNGWTTSYYHVASIKVRAGQTVSRGALLGYTSTNNGCGGWASGPHVHFTVIRNGSYVNLDGLAIGGWTVREGKGQYYGCLVRDGSKRCAPGGSVYNSGAIGSG